MGTDKTICVLFLAVEADPLIKVGGLGDVAGSLPRAIKALSSQDINGYKIDIRIAIPFHSAIKLKIGTPLPIASISVPHPAGEIPAYAYLSQIDNIPVYLIDGPPILPNSPVYTNNELQDGEKYIYFSLAALETVRALQWQPDILHANDWHTALAVYHLALNRAKDPFFAHTRSVLSIHNLPFMGAGAANAVKAFGYKPSQDQRLPDWARSFPLPLGLISADHVIAVSPNYGQEILTPAFGCGLQDMLRTRSSTISGILNGLDQQTWNPASDSLLDVNFSIHSIDQRVQNKLKMQADFNLPVNPEIPLLIMIGRMDQQKGIDLALGGLQKAINHPWQVIILGTGDPLIESAARSLEAEYPDRVRAVIRFDGALSHRMYASGDMILMPSRYEPCGLAQMIAMRYGCVPVARATGGLQDTIEDRVTGFLFQEATESSFTKALSRALNSFNDKPSWLEIQKKGMAKDFSWTKSAIDYSKIYIHLMEE